jgi:hypothetical protein
MIEHCLKNIIYVGHAALPPGKTRYPLYRRLDGPQGRSGRVRNISPPPGFFLYRSVYSFDPRTVQPVVSHSADWATQLTKNYVEFALRPMFI